MNLKEKLVQETDFKKSITEDLENQVWGFNYIKRGP